MTVSLLSQGVAQNTGGAGTDTLTNFEDLRGSRFADMLTGDAERANDIDGGAGIDTMTGGDGSDTFFLNSASDVIVELAGEGDDRAFTTASYVIAAGVSLEELFADPSNSPINLTGNGLANGLIGNDGANALDGGAGADTMAAGGATTPTRSTMPATRSSRRRAAAPTRSSASVSYVLGSDVENLALTGTADLSGTGNGLANVLSGNDGANALDGGAGADTMAGRRWRRRLHGRRCRRSGCRGGGRRDRHGPVQRQLRWPRRRSSRILRSTSMRAPAAST